MTIKEMLINEDLPLGRILGFSKVEYRRDHPHNVTCYNASIVTATHGFVWSGDLDLTKDAAALKRVTAELGETLYIFREGDSAYMIEGKPQPELLVKAIWDTTKPILIKNIW
jgi:hypothetical protein